MRFSTRATYGLKALLYLADSYQAGAVSASQIARQEGISAPYLEQILHLLKKKQWVKSLRGPSGGYVLAARPSEIRVGPVLRDLEGPSAPRAKAPVKAARGNAPSAAAELFWDRLEREVAKILDGATLKELLEQAPRKGHGSSKFSFNI